MNAVPTITQLAADLAAGRRTSQQLTEAALTRAQDPASEGARVFTLIDAERARAAAQASDTLRAVGIVRSPLEGLPVSVKDLFDVAGMPSTAASQSLAQAAPATSDSVAVARLRARGVNQKRSPSRRPIRPPRQ